MKNLELSTEDILLSNNSLKMIKEKALSDLHIVGFLASKNESSIVAMEIFSIRNSNPAIISLMLFKHSIWERSVIKNEQLA
jgi:hypothetical protein